MLVGNIISIISYLIIFTTHMWPMAVRLTVLIVAMVIHKIGYSFQASVTKAGQAVLTNDPKQRPLFAAFDGIFNIGVFTGGQILISSVLIPKHGEFNLAFFKEFILIITITSIVLCILAMIGISAKDRKEFYGLGFETVETKGFKEYWKVIKKNRTLQTLCLSAAADKLAVTVFQDSVVTVMLFAIVLGNYALSGKISAISIIPDLAITFAATWLARKTDLKTFFSSCILIALVSYLGLGAVSYFAPTGTIGMNLAPLSIAFILLFSVAKSAARTPTTLVITMTADVSDAETAESGRYIAGMVGTIFSFIDSIAASFGPLIVGWVCAAAGFAEKYPTIETPQTPGLKYATLALVCVIPAFLMLISFIAMKFYPLNKEKMEEVQSIIPQKKEKGHEH